MKQTEQQKQLEKQIRKASPGLLNGMAGEKKAQLLRLLEMRIPEPTGVVLTQTTQMTSSPVPPAELLMGYNAAIDGGAERLMTLVENQSAHRQTIEVKVIESQILQSRIGQILAFVLALVFGWIGYQLCVANHAEVGGTIFATTIIALVTTFIAGQKGQKRNLDQKAPK